MLLIILSAVLGLLFVALGIYLLTGRGWFLLAGFNMMSDTEKEKYDAAAICKFNSKISLIVGIFTFFLGIESIIRWYVWVYLVFVIFLAIFAAVYCSTGDRFKK